MPSRVVPSAILLQTNLSGAVTAIDEDPDSPDGSWLTAIDDGNNTDLRVSFPTPDTLPVVGVGRQEFRAWVRASGGGANPDARFELWESGTLVTVGSLHSVGSTSGQIISWTWDAAVLADPTGAGVECRIFGAADGGLLDSDDTIEVGAVEWNASIPPLPIFCYHESILAIGDVAGLAYAASAYVCEVCNVVTAWPGTDLTWGDSSAATVTTTLTPTTVEGVPALRITTAV